MVNEFKVVEVKFRKASVVMEAILELERLRDLEEEIPNRKIVIKEGERVCK